MFFVIEGIDACGKDTVLDKLKTSEMFADALFTREPGGTPEAERIREVMLSTANDTSPNTEVLLAFASREEHINKVIWPALNEGKHVVSSRFYQSTSAYQGANGADPMLITHLIQRLIPLSASPDLTILIDIPVSESFRRKNLRNLDLGEQDDAIERRSLDYFNKVRMNYLEMAMHDPRTIVIRGTDSPETVLYTVASAIDSVMRGKPPMEFRSPLRPSLQALSEVVTELKNEINGFDGGQSQNI